MIAKRFRTALAVLLAAGCAGAGDRAEPAKPLNFLLLVSDDQQPDAIRVLGNAHLRTPRLDALVRSGIAFTRAVAPNPVCVTSRAEILTGASCFRNGVFPKFSRKLNPDLPLWPEVMREAGYHTWYVGKWHTEGQPVTKGYEETRGLYVGGYRPAPRDVDGRGRPITGYRGWVFADDAGKRYPGRGIGLTDDISAKFADAAIEFLRREPEKPFFLHVNFTAPHDPLLVAPEYAKAYPPDRIPLPPNYRPAHPFDHGYATGRDEKLLPVPRTERMIREELSDYYAVIEHMDREIGRILDVLRETGKAGNTIVIFTSDHGLAVGRHGLRGKQNMYDHTVGVPLVFSGPGLPRGRRTRAQVYLRDLYPAVCEMAGIPVPETVEGRSFLPVLEGRRDSFREYVYGYFMDVQRMVRGDRWKYIRYPVAGREQLFDLAADPHEVKDLSTDSRHAAVLTGLRSKLAAWQRKMGDPILDQ